MPVKRKRARKVPASRSKAPASRSKAPASRSKSPVSSRKKYKQWSEESMLGALKAVQDGAMGCNRAAVEYQTYQVSSIRLESQAFGLNLKLSSLMVPISSILITLSSLDNYGGLQLIIRYCPRLAGYIGTVSASNGFLGKS